MFKHEELLNRRELINKLKNIDLQLINSTKDNERLKLQKEKNKLMEALKNIQE